VSIYSARGGVTGVRTGSRPLSIVDKPLGRPVSEVAPALQLVLWLAQLSRRDNRALLGLHRAACARLSVTGMRVYSANIRLEAMAYYADLLDWYRVWDVTLDTTNPPFWRWFVGGRINASYNCIDRHLANYKNKTAIHFIPELEHEAIQHVTYQELYARVNEVAALLRDFCGLKKGDRVTLHMPMVAELPVTMLACARLGVIHSQVFSGFSGKATADRIVDSEGRVLITMDAYYRGGELLDHKEKTNIAFDEAEKDGVRLEKVLVWQRYPGRYSSKTPLVEGRDFIMNEVLSMFPPSADRPGRDAGRGPLVPDVHQRHHWEAEGMPAQHRRISSLCSRDVEVHSGHPSGGCLLVHGRYRLDHRSFLYRLWAVGARRLFGGV
jgi:AMP-binding enzyme/Acetyl-coenzyme A synthetase N-terminus